jgi:CheY-like chemotaxis protein
LIERALAARPEIRLVAGKLGASAVDLALTHRPSLILLDLHLPDLGGDQVLRRLKVSAATSEIPVVIVSADATSEQIKSMLSEGAVEYLTKPLDIERLLTVVDEALQMGASNERYATKSD